MLTSTLKILAPALALMAMSQGAYASDLSAVMSTLEEQSSAITIIWVMLAACLVIMMQGGFMFLEAGMVRSKNSINVAQKNLIDFIVSVLVFYAFGFMLMFGTSQWGLFGWDTSLLFMSGEDSWNAVFFVFQAAFVGTCATIVSGAVAERMTLSSYIYLSVIIAAIIYPVAGHWGWGNLLNGDNTSYLTNIGFIDFAGSTVVHSVGAWVALAACIVIGPRAGRFGNDGEVKKISGHSFVLSAFGCLMLWVGWFGFNAGSTTALTEDVSGIAFNTLIASVCAGLVGMVIGRLDEGYFSPEHAINGVLGGLVAITAGCATVTGFGALVIGLMAGAVMYFSSKFILEHLRIDDALGAISVHGVCGAFGTLALVFFMKDGTSDLGIVEQLWVQFQGVAIYFAWAFGMGYAACKILDFVIGTRVSAEHEDVGLNAAEHNASLGIGVLVNAMKDVVDGSKDLSRRIKIDQGDEAYEAAELINTLIAQMQTVMRGMKKDADRLKSNSERMSYLSTDLSVSSDNATANAKDIIKLNLEMADQTNIISANVSDLLAGIGLILQNVGSVSGNMRDIADEMNSLSDSVDVVAENTKGASGMSQEAATYSSDAKKKSDELIEATEEITTVVDLIRQISEGINVLALNASVEAARSGEHGRGFHVISQEIKNLAKQTGAAIETIEGKISRVRMSSEDMNENIGAVVTTVENIRESISGISEIAEAQAEASKKISQAAHCTFSDITNINAEMNSIKNGVASIARSATDAKVKSEHVRSRVTTLADEARVGKSLSSDATEASQKVSEVSRSLTNVVKQYQV